MESDPQQIVKPYSGVHRIGSCQLQYEGRLLGIPKARPNLGCRKGLDIKTRLCLGSRLVCLASAQVWLYRLLHSPLPFYVVGGGERAHLLLPEQTEYTTGTEEGLRLGPPHAQRHLSLSKFSLIQRYLKMSPEPSH